MEGLQIILKQLDIMHGRLDKIDEAGSERGRRIWEKLNQQDLALALLDQRFNRLEESVNGQALTLAEYQKLKIKAEGAGWLGRRLWVAGGIVLTMAGGIYSSWTAIATAIKWLIGRAP